jgi:hypothetical protein
MSIKALGLYGGVFVGMLVLALFTTGTFQQGILPRLSGHGASEGAGEGAPGPAAEAGPKAPAPSVEAQNPAAPPVPVAEASPEPAAALTNAPPPVRGEAAAGIEAGREAQVKRLARIYEGMRPKEAAAVLEKIERPLATQVLHGVKERQAAKILAAMNPAVAAELTHLLGPTGERVMP